MTLDEAIQHAEEVADKCALTDGNILCENDHRQLAEWLTDYKRLLEQEPCEDAISRQAVLDMMQMRMSGKELYKAVYELPSVNPQPKTGHWKIKRASIHPYGSDVACSECGFTMGSSFGYSYCPSCGARMESEA